MASKDYFGEGCIDQIQNILRKLHAKRIFLVTGEKLFKLSGAANKILPYLQACSIKLFDDYCENPNIKDVVKGIDVYKKFQPDVVIAVGGGSAIDIAKSINILSAQTDNYMDFVLKKQKIYSKGVPLLAIPTTSGTGSESTCFSVLYIDKLKYSLEHEYILPDYTIIDPTLSYSLPPDVTASTGFDALSQGIESFWSVNSTEESRNYASQAIKLVINSIQDAVKTPTPLLRKEMSLGAHLAGKAINISKTTAPHALSYQFTINHKIPHGHAVGLTLGKFLTINSDLKTNQIIDPRGRDYVQKTMESLCLLLGEKTPQTCTKKLYQLMENIGLETNFKKLRITKRADIHNIIESVNLERLANNPVKITKEMFYSLFE